MNPNPSDPLQAALRPTWTTHAHTRRHCGLGQYYGLWEHYAVRKPPARPSLRAPAAQHGKHMRGTCWQLCAHSDPLQAALRPPRATHSHTRHLCGVATEDREQHDRSASRPRTQACLPRLPAWQPHARHLLARMRSMGSTPSCSAPHLDHPRTHEPPMWTGPVWSTMRSA